MTRGTRSTGSRRDRGWLAGLLCLLGSVLAAGTARAQTDTCVPTVPCVDGGGTMCPDLIIDQDDLALYWFVENRRFNKNSCALQEGAVSTAGVRTLLRFTSSTPNLGPGQLFLGDPALNPDWFHYDTCHRHYHLKEYTDYRLWTPAGYDAWIALRASAGGSPTCARDLLAAHPEIASQMVSGHKQGFCVIDLWAYLKPPCPPTPLPDQYFSCDSNQGLSVCWVDSYDAYLDGQWIDVTDVADGIYILELEANAEHFFTEADYTNNSAAIQIGLVKPPRRGGRR